MKNTVRIGAGSGFWGDGFDPAWEVLDKGELDYLCFDFLAELTMALLQRQRKKNPDSGYVPDAVRYMRDLMALAKARGTKLISNGGGVNPQAAGLAIVEAAREQGLDLTVGIVEGDDFLGKLDLLRADGVPLEHMETGAKDFDSVRDKVVCANVYTDGTAVAEALRQGADIVVTGRVSDNGLYVGAAMHAFDWEQSSRFRNQIAAAITLGHIVECASACTGGMSSRFAEMPNMGKVGFPIVELAKDGSAVVTKVEGSGGKVDQFTIKEHLVYEIADPRQYLMPDGVPDFTSLSLEELGPDRVSVCGVTGEGPPDMLKLVIGYEDGWIGESMAFFPSPNAYDRACKARETMLERLERMNMVADDIQFDFVGLNMLHGPGAPEIDPAMANRLPELGLRCAAKTKTRDDADKVRRASSNLWIMGPGGTSFGTPQKPRPVTALWPTLIPRKYVQQTVTLMEA